MRGYWLPAALCLCVVLGCDDGPSFGPTGPVEPDLEAASIDIPKLHQGETITVTVTIRSSGLLAVPAPFSVTLLVSLDSDCSTDYCGPFEWRREEVDGDLLRGEELVLEAEVPVGAGDAVGTPLYFLVTADAWGEVDEGVETNNELAATALIMPPPGPDLRVQSCEPVGVLREGKTGTIRVTIVNAGEVSAPAPFDVQLALYANSDYTGFILGDSHDQLTALAPGQTATFDTSVPATLTRGYIYYVAEVDTAWAVPEHDYYRGDNSLQGSIWVYPPLLPDLIISLTWDAGEPSGTDYTFTVTVRNLGMGESPAGSYRLSVYCDGVLLASETDGFPALSPGGMYVQPWIFPDIPLWPAGNYEVEATVDYTDSVEESNESNNVSNRLAYTL